MVSSGGDPVVGRGHCGNEIEFNLMVLNYLIKTKFWIIRCYNKINSIDDNSNKIKEKFDNYKTENNIYLDQLFDQTYKYYNDTDIQTYIETYETPILNSYDLTYLRISPDINQLLHNTDNFAK